MHRITCKPTDRLSVVRRNAVAQARLWREEVEVHCGGNSIPNPICVAKPDDDYTSLALRSEFERWHAENDCDPLYVCFPKAEEVHREIRRFVDVPEPVRVCLA